MVTELPETPEELTAFFLKENKTLFEYCHDNDVSEIARSEWIIRNKHWAVDMVTLKLSEKIENIPMLVILFSSKAICFNRVILAPFRTDWSREELFDGFGLTQTRLELITMCKDHFEKSNEPIVVYTKG